MLDDPLTCQDPAPELKGLLAEAFWDTPARDVFPGLEQYFRYYAGQCGLIALHEGGRYVSFKSHRDIIPIVKQLRENRTREDISDSLGLASSTVAKHSQDYTIDLAARLLLMMEFGNLHFAHSGFRQIEWREGSLQDFVTERFENPPALKHNNIKLAKIFTARNLGKIAGIEIAWTANLADHLRLIRDDKAVAIFHHASFLKRQERDACLYPKALIAETLYTIALLFPKWDQDTRRWYLYEASLKELDPYLVEIDHLDADQRQIEKFYYWHDRLVVLKQVFDESLPGNLRQWWSDRRNGVQWYTFWVAILVLVLTVVFGLIQSIEGALQVYKAFTA